MPKPKEPASTPEDALWKHVTELHKKHADLAVAVANQAPKEPAGEEVMGLVAAAGMIEARIQKSQSETCAALEPLRRAIEGNAQRLEDDIKSRDANTAAITRLCECIDTMTSPRTRTGVVDLPTGRVQMTITEAHDKRKEH